MAIGECVMPDVFWLKGTRTAYMLLCTNNPDALHYNAGLKDIGYVMKYMS